MVRAGSEGIKKNYDSLSGTNSATSSREHFKIVHKSFNVVVVTGLLLRRRLIVVGFILCLFIKV